VRLHIHRAEFGADDGARRTVFEAAGASAVFADVGGHEPGESARVLHADGHRAFDETDVTPRGRTERHGVVVGHAAEVVTIVGQLVPLFAGDLTGLATNTESSVGEETCGGHAVYV